MRSLHNGQTILNIRLVAVAILDVFDRPNISCPLGIIRRNLACDRLAYEMLNHWIKYNNTLGFRIHLQSNKVGNPNIFTLKLTLQKFQWRQKQVNLAQQTPTHPKQNAIS